jgi:hypothetical protein
VLVAGVHVREETGVERVRLGWIFEHALGRLR